MIGKKAAIGIIAATGVVAVGVPVGIVVGQHAAKTGSLDSKMQSKWSDIEKELASSFGGFDVRNKIQQDATQKSLDKNLKGRDENKALINRILGANQNDAFFNSFVSIKQSINDRINESRQIFEAALDKYASEGFTVSNGKIAINEFGFTTSANKITLVADLNGATGVFKQINTESGSAPKQYEIPYIVNLSIKHEDSGDVVQAKIDEASFNTFIFGQAGTSAMGSLFRAINDSLKPNNILRLEDEVTIMKNLLKVAPDNSQSSFRKSIRSFVTGESGGNAKFDSFFKNGFGLKDYVENFGFDEAKGFFGDYEEVSNGMISQIIYLNYSLNGHHDKRLVDAAIKNLKDNLQIDFPTAVSDAERDKETEKMFSAKEFTIDPSYTIVEVSKCVGENPQTTHDAIVDPTGMFVDSKRAIDEFNAKQESKDANLYTFTNEERYQWLVDEGRVRDYSTWDDEHLNHVIMYPGEILQNVTVSYRDFKNGYQADKDWFDTNEFALVWNERLFNSILDKYNISASDATFEIKVKNENQSEYVLSVMPNGQLFIKSSSDKSVVSNKPLFLKSVTDEPREKYPLSDGQWYNKDFVIAYSSTPKVAGSTDPKNFYDFEENAPFLLDGNSDISFAISISSNEMGKVYKNTDNNRQADNFAFNQKGELFIHNGARD